MISAACNYLLEKDYTPKQQVNNETRKESYEGLAFGQSIGQDNLLLQIDDMYSSSLGSDTRLAKAELENLRKTDSCNIVESDSPLFMRERANSYEDMSPEGGREND